MAGAIKGPFDEERRASRIRKSSHSRTAALEKIEEMVALGLKHPLVILMELANGFELVEMDVYDRGVTVKKLVPQEMKAGLTRTGDQAYGVDGMVRAKAASELANYIYPKKKSIEHTGSDGSPIVFGVVPDFSPLPSDTPADNKVIEASGTSSTPIKGPVIDYLGPMPEIEEEDQPDAPADIP